MRLLEARYGRLPECDSPDVARASIAEPLTADERLCLSIIRDLGQEALERLLLAGRYQWVHDTLAGRQS
jgi:hypothetical protein